MIPDEFAYGYTMEDPDFSGVMSYTGLADMRDKLLVISILYVRRDGTRHVSRCRFKFSHIERGVPVWIPDTQERVPAVRHPPATGLRVPDF